MYVFSFIFILYLFFSCISFTEHRNNVNPGNTIGNSSTKKMNDKRSHEYQSMDPEYVTGQINSRILELLLRQFCCLIFEPSRKS